MIAFNHCSGTWGHVFSMAIHPYTSVRHRTDQGTIATERSLVRAKALARLNCLVGVVLLVAGTAKVSELGTTPSRATAVGFELVLALWLLSGACQQIASYTALATFSVFAVFSGWQTAMGARSCGCFGPMAVPPMATLGVDVAVVLAIVACRPWSVRAVARLGMIPCSIGIVFIVLTLFCAPHLRPARLFAFMSHGGLSSKLVVLEPGDWVGKPFPIRDDIQWEGSDAEIDVGNWIVVLYTRDCPRCAGFLRSFAHPLSGSRRCLFIEIPTLNETSPPAPTEIPGAVYAKLSAAHEWFVEAPVVITLAGGAVTSVEFPKD